MAQALSQILLQQQHHEQMLVAQQKLHKFLGMVAHDLRGPLGCIQGYAEVLPQCDSESERQQIVEQISRISHKGLKMVQSLLNYATLKTGHLPLNKSRFNLKTLISQSLAEYRELLASRHLHAECLWSEQTQVYADPERIQQVLDNLIGNLVKYATPGSHVSLRVSAQPEQIQVLLENERLVPPQPAAHLHSGLTGGVGLGLEIVREILAEHGHELQHHWLPSGLFHLSFSLERA